MYRVAATSRVIASRRYVVPIGHETHITPNPALGVVEELHLGAGVWMLMQLETGLRCYRVTDGILFVCVN